VQSWLDSLILREISLILREIRASTRARTPQAGHHDHPTMITGERGARKPAGPVREETDAMDPTTGTSLAVEFTLREPGG